MVKDTIQAVKTAENDAIKLARETAQKREQIVSEARQSVVTQKKETDSVLMEEREKALLEAANHNEMIMKEAVEDTMKEVSLLQAQAKEKQEEALQLILAELI